MAKNVNNLRKDNMNKPLMHGENIFKPVNKLPDGKVTRHKLFVAGHSESGHHHVLESKTEFEVIEGEKEELFVRLFEPAKVVHKKTFEIHETKTLEPGIYAIYPAQEYNPFTKVMERQYD